MKDFDISFVRRLSLEDGAATLTEYTSEILYEYLIDPEGGTLESTMKIIGEIRNAKRKTTESKGRTSNSTRFSQERLFKRF